VAPAAFHVLALCQASCGRSILCDEAARLLRGTQTAPHMARGITSSPLILHLSHPAQDHYKELFCRRCFRCNDYVLTDGIGKRACIYSKSQPMVDRNPTIVTGHQERARMAPCTTPPALPVQCVGWCAPRTPSQVPAQSLVDATYLNCVCSHHSV